MIEWRWLLRCSRRREWVCPGDDTDREPHIAFCSLGDLFRFSSLDGLDRREAMVACLRCCRGVGDGVGFFFASDSMYSAFYTNISELIWQTWHGGMKCCLERKWLRTKNASRDYGDGNGWLPNAVDLLVSPRYLPIKVIIVYLAQELTQP